jgi:hypothetical protein
VPIPALGVRRRRDIEVCVIVSTAGRIPNEGLALSACDVHAGEVIVALHGRASLRNEAVRPRDLLTAAAPLGLRPKPRSRFVPETSNTGFRCLPHGVFWQITLR